MTSSPAPIRVLFLCTGNSARSQLAEAMLAHRSEGRFVVASAGTQPAARVHPDAVATLADKGIEWQERRPKSVDEVIGSPWDLVITVCDNARESCPILPGTALSAHWGVDDPADVVDPAKRRAAFIRAAEILEYRIEQLMAISTDERRRPDFRERVNALGTLTPDAGAA